MGRLPSDSMIWLMAISSKKFYATHGASQVCCSENPCPCGWPLMTRASTGDTEALNGRSAVSVGSLGPSAHKVLFEPSEGLVGMRFDSRHDLPPPTILLKLSFALGSGVSFCGGIQHSPVDGCSAVSSNFLVLVGEDESTFFYSTIL